MLEHHAYCEVERCFGRLLGYIIQNGVCDHSTLFNVQQVANEGTYLPNRVIFDVFTGGSHVQAWCRIRYYGAVDWDRDCRRTCPELFFLASALNLASRLLLRGGNLPKAIRVRFYL